MKIEVGKRYIRRDGTVTRALVEDYVPDTGYALDPDTRFVYRTQGGPVDHQVFSYMEWPCDLMMEYTNV